MDLDALLSHYFGGDDLDSLDQTALARAAREALPCPDDASLAVVYGTRSPGRVKRLLAFIEARGLIASRIDLSGKRSIALPRLGWTTAPAEATHEPA